MSGTHDQSAGARQVEQPTGAYPQYARYRESETGGMTALAGWFLILGGVWSFFIGLGIVIRKAYFTSLPSYTAISANYPYHWNIGAWGWANFILGIVVVAAGVCVLLGQGWARWAGIVLAVISGIGTFLFLPFYPFWSILVIALDVFIIWALATARRRQDLAAL